MGKDGAINPNYYEMGAWQRLREGVRAGDIAVPQSRRYRAFEDDLLSRAEWEALKRQNETRLAVTDDPDAYLAETQETIAELLDQLPALLDEEDYLMVDDEGQLRLSAPEKTTPAEVAFWRRICTNAMPEMQLAEIIIEVDRWTSCLDAFRGLGSDLPAEGTTRQLLIAAIMATGMNLELTQMARATDFSYEQLRQVADNFIREDTIRPALATLDNFVLHLLGFRFAPRIRSITDQYLFSAYPLTTPAAVAHLWKGEADRDLVRRNWDPHCRLAASIRHGTVSASLIMRKLAAYPRQNELAEALNEIGKLERTVFVLNYWLDPALQKRVRRGLNKGESVYRLARAVAIDQEGEMRERELYDQMNRASCLMLLVGMIAAWNTVYLDRTVASLQEQGAPVPPEYLQHISPLGWRHINFLGRYEFDLDQTYSLDNLRPLRKLPG